MTRLPNAEIKVVAQLPLNLAESLFDRLPDVVFFAKDCDGRYTHGNRSLLERLGLRRRELLIGRRVTELFPHALGHGYAEQDRKVITSGQGVLDQLEVHLLTNGGRGWCLTCKHPLHAENRVVGLVGISRDLPRLPAGSSLPAALRTIIERILGEFDQPLRIVDLAAQAGISVDQLERRMRQLLSLGPRQLLVRTRIDAAIGALAGSESIATVAQACGYSDQSAFSRQFKAVVGISPSSYRRRLSASG